MTDHTMTDHVPSAAFNAMFDQIGRTSDWLSGYLTALNLGPDSVASEVWVDGFVDRERLKAKEPERVIAFALSMRDAIAKDLREGAMQFVVSNDNAAACEEYARGFRAGVDLHPSWVKDEAAVAILRKIETDGPNLTAHVRALRDHWLARKSAPRAQRNDPCPCGSGKKYKKCCLP